MAIPTRLNTSAEVLAACDEFGYDSGTDNKLGDLSESGLRVAITTEENPLRSGTQVAVYAYLKGTTDQLWAGELLNINLNNYAFALGQDEDAANITGTGTSGDPYILVVDPEVFGEQVARTYYAQGTREDATIIRAEASARVFAPDIEFTMSQGDATMIPFALRITGSWAIHQWS